MASGRISASIVTIVLILASAASTTIGCRAGNLLGSTSSSTTVISPNGDGLDDFAMLGYSLSARSQVSIWLESATARRYIIRYKEPRESGHYQARFDGSYAPDPDGADRRILPNGTYQFVIEAVDDQGRREEGRGRIDVVNADTVAPEIENLGAIPDAISPNGDSKDDETLIQYGITKDAEVTIVANGPNVDAKYLLEAPNQKHAGLYSYNWNGTSSAALLQDGKYIIHIMARDKSGNVTERVTPVTINGGGKPKLQITRVQFSPTSVFLGGDLNVKIMVKNTGDTLIRTMGPPPGTAYSTNMTYNYWLEDDGATPKYFERPGLWRVAVMWNLAGSPYPVRWGLPKDLAPGEEATIAGTIKVLSRTPELRFWAAVEQSGVGFPGGDVGIQTIRVGY
ncbi:MAG: hypothetical protein Q7O66_09040 [Dehalococcoidia bacterium]|nr:hypothetical protein [Dehalococcoidia bacterium]